MGATLGMATKQNSSLKSVKSIYGRVVLRRCCRPNAILPTGQKP